MRWEVNWLENRARLTPNSKAIIDAETQSWWSYKQLNDRALSLATWLVTKGVKKGDRIALLAPNDISYFDLLFACKKIGAIFVPLNWRLATKELNDIIHDSSPIMIGVHVRFKQTFNSIGCQNSVNFLVGDKNYDKLANNCNVFRREIGDTIDLLDPLMIIYTGGTTGKSKGVVLSHQSVLWNAMNTILSWNLTCEDITLTNIPMFHTGGINALSIPLLLIGGTVVIADQFDATKTLHYLSRYQCSIVLLIPTMYHMLIQAEAFRVSQFPKMKVFLSGGAPCPLEIYEAFWEKGLLFKEGYGLTEAGPNNFYIDPNEAMAKRGSVGKAMLFNSIKLMKSNDHEAEVNEVGEIWIKGKHCFSHYWENEVATSEVFMDGWLCTGDLARKDEDGYYYIVGRKKEMIITGGENVYPLEVEQWLLTHPSVHEVAVVGIPDSKWGEVVTAFIVTTGVINTDDLKDYCSRKLGKFKIPKNFYSVEHLPKTHVGKIDKKSLQDLGLIESYKSKRKD